MNIKTSEILNTLLTKYEHSKHYQGKASNRSIFLDSKDEIFHDVFISPNAYKYINEVPNDLDNLEKDQYIFLRYEKVHHQLDRITLNLDKISKLYSLIGKANPKDSVNEYLLYLEDQNATGVCKRFIDDEIIYLSSNYKLHKIYYSSLQNLKDLLICLNSIYELKEEMMIRDFSTRVLKDSKKFEKIKSSVVSIIRKYDDSILDTYNDDEILESLNLVKNSTYALIKNKLNFKLNDQIINLDKLSFEYCLDDKMIKAMEILDSDFENVVTVENLTTFHKFNMDNSIVIYLAGFHNHTKRMLINKINKAFPNKNWYHYGDIDAGGFKIFIDLKEKSGIDFKPLHMDLKELMNPKYNYKKLENNDVKNLQLLLSDERYTIFHPQIRYMLENNIKLEQENLD